MRHTMGEQGLDKQHVSAVLHLEAGVAVRAASHRAPHLAQIAVYGFAGIDVSHTTAGVGTARPTGDRTDGTMPGLPANRYGRDRKHRRVQLSAPFVGTDHSAKQGTSRKRIPLKNTTTRVSARRYARSVDPFIRVSARAALSRCHLDEI